MHRVVCKFDRLFLDFRRLNPQGLSGQWTCDDDDDNHDDDQDKGSDTNTELAFQNGKNFQWMNGEYQRLVAFMMVHR